MKFLGRKRQIVTDFLQVEPYLYQWMLASQ